MDANKTVNEELQGQKSTNMLIGYVLSLALMFVAFEYTQREVKVVDDSKIYDYNMEEDMIPVTNTVVTFRKLGYDGTSPSCCSYCNGGYQ